MTDEYRSEFYRICRKTAEYRKQASSAQCTIEHWLYNFMVM